MIWGQAQVIFTFTIPQRDDQSSGFIGLQTDLPGLGGLRGLGIQQVDIRRLIFLNHCGDGGSDLLNGLKIGALHGLIYNQLIDPLADDFTFVT